MDLNTKVVLQIQREMQRRSWSSYELAERAGIAASTMQRIVNHNNSPTLTMLGKILVVMPFKITI